MIQSVPKERLFSDYYDSVQQRQLRWEEPPESDYENPKVAYQARLRFDILLSRRLVLTDTQLLDGLFFLNSDPQELWSSVARAHGQAPPIEVQARVLDLEESLVRFVSQPNNSNLRGFSFSAIQNPEARSEVKNILQMTSSEYIKSWHDIPPLLRSAGVSLENVDMLESGWARWIEAQKNGLVKLTTSAGPFRVDEALGDPAVLDKRLRDDDAREIAKWVYEHRGDRSLVDVTLSDLISHSIEEGLADLYIVENWFHQAYNRTIAWTYGCTHYESVYNQFRRGAAIRPRVDRVLVKSDSDIEVGVADVALELPREFLIGIGRMPNDLFKDLFSRNQGLFERWWVNGDIEALRSAFIPFIDASTTAGGSNGPHLPQIKARRSTEILHSTGPYVDEFQLLLANLELYWNLGDRTPMQLRQLWVHCGLSALFLSALGVSIFATTILDNPAVLGPTSATALFAILSTWAVRSLFRGIGRIRGSKEQLSSILALNRVLLDALRKNDSEKAEDAGSVYRDLLGARHKPRGIFAVPIQGLYDRLILSNINT